MVSGGGGEECGAFCLLGGGGGGTGGGGGGLFLQGHQKGQLKGREFLIQRRYF